MRKGLMRKVPKVVQLHPTFIRFADVGDKQTWVVKSLTGIRVTEGSEMSLVLSWDSKRLKDIETIFFST